MQTLQEKYKYNPFLKYGDELEEIISKKEYDEDISNMLRLSFPIMIEYYGHEYKNILFDALKQTDIVLPKDDENMYDIVKKYTPSNIIKKSQISAVTDRELKKADGVNSLTPIFEIVDGKPKMIGKVQVVSIIKSDNSLDNLSKLVHELSHAFKSYQNGIDLIQDDDGNQILASRSGISTIYSKVYLEDEKIVIDDIQEKNLGLEEGINTYDENNIINKILSLPTNEVSEKCRVFKNSLVTPFNEEPYISKGYVQETICAEKLLTKCKLLQTIRQDQFLGTNNIEDKYNLITNNSQNTWNILNQKVDKSVKHTYDIYKHASFDFTQWFEEHKDEITDNLQNIHDMLDDCASNINEQEINIPK